MTNKTLLRKTRQELVKILTEQAEVVSTQSEIIEKLQTFQISAEKEFRERMDKYL